MVDPDHFILSIILGSDRVLLLTDCEMTDGNKVIVIYDPDEECGYIPGAEFYWHEMEHMLMYRAFSVDTIIKYRSEYYIVRNLGGKSNSQILVVVDPPECLSQGVTLATRCQE